MNIMNSREKQRKDFDEKLVSAYFLRPSIRNQWIRLTSVTETTGI